MEELKIGNKYLVNWKGQVVTGKLLKVVDGWWEQKYLFEVSVHHYEDGKKIYTTSEVYKTTIDNILK